MDLESWKRRAERLESEVYALYLAYHDDRTPLAARGVIVLVVAYAVSPIDPSQFKDQLRETREELRQLEQEIEAIKDPISDNDEH